MFVPVEYRPDLVVFLERILYPVTAPIESQFTGVLDCFFRDCMGNANSGNCFHGDQGVSIDSADRAEIDGLGILALAKQDKVPLGFLLRAATPRVRNAAPGGLSTTSQELNQ